MNKAQVVSIPNNPNLLVLERFFNAPPELIFQMHHQEEYVKMWSAPKNWIVFFCKINFHVGGEHRRGIRCSKTYDQGHQGEEQWGKSVYSKIVDSEEIVYRDYYTNAAGEPFSGSSVGEVKLRFTKLDRGSKLIRYSQYDDSEALHTAIAYGLIEDQFLAWDQLEALLPK